MICESKNKIEDWNLNKQVNQVTEPINKQCENFEDNYQTVSNMGNHEVLASNIETLKPQNWVEAGQDQQNAFFSNVNPFRRRLLANIITHELIEEYELSFITEEDYNSYVAQLTYRQAKSNLQNSPNFIYPIRYFVNKSKHQMCTTIHIGYLYVDKVELRLKQINDIPFQDLLYMYKATLNGFKALYEKVGYFDIIEEMIFITKTGQVKVWMNANLAKNYPNYQKTSYSSNPHETAFSQRQSQHIYGSQADMIRKLILMIEKNSDQYLTCSNVQTPQNLLFSQFLQQKNLFDKLSFQHSLDELQNYLRQNNFHSPDHMRSIPELFAPDQIPHNGLTNYEQSHVNEITSQHLTQMKKKFQPMETIVQDERFNTKIAHQINHSRQVENFKESLITIYKPHATSINQENHANQIQQRRVNKYGNPSGNNLNQSRYSHQSNSIKPNEYAHLQKSAHSSINIKPSQTQKPNSVSPSNSKQFIHQGPNFIGHSIPPIQYHNKVPVNENLMTKNPNQIPKFGSNSNQISYAMIISPPPNQRIINRETQYRQAFNQNLSKQFFPSQSFQNPQIFNTNQAHIRSSDLNHPSRIGQQNFTHQNIHHRFATENKTKNIFPPVQNFRKQSFTQQLKPDQGSQKVSAKNQFAIEEIKKKEERVEQKSGIKYFTKNDSYQLDEEIANDLQKFLGLKVQ